MAHKDDEGPSRFSYLEVDDDKPRAVREAERVTAEERRRAEEVAHASHLAQLERDRTEEIERRTTLRHERRSKRTKARRSIHAAKNRLNDYLHKIGLKYHASKSDVVDRILEEALKEGFEQAGEVDAQDNRLIYFMVDADGKEYGLNVSFYHMPSGRWEVTSYIS